MIKLAVALKIFGIFWGHIPQPEQCSSQVVMIPKIYSATQRERDSVNLVMKIGSDNNSYRQLLKELEEPYCTAPRSEMYEWCASYRAEMIADTQHLSLIAGCQCALSKNTPPNALHDCSMLKFKTKKRKKKK